MKSLLVLCLLAVAVSALPSKKVDYDDSEESFFLFPFRQNKKQVPSVVEVEVGDSGEDSDEGFFPTYFRPFFTNPFSFMNFGFSDFFSRPSWIDSLVPKGIPDDAIKNSTSSTKIVDGHKITMNETTYENEKNGAVYKFQIIEISPVDSKEKGEPTTIETEVTREEASPRPTEDVKPDQNSQDNEIHREEKMFESYELQSDDPSIYDKNVEMIDVGNNQLEKREKSVDLSSDIRVNALLAENARRGGLFMVPPEVEVFDTLDYDALAGNYRQMPLDAQEIIQPQFNQKIVRPQFNQQQVVHPQYNQQPQQI